MRDDVLAVLASDQVGRFFHGRVAALAIQGKPAKRELTGRNSALGMYDAFVMELAQSFHLLSPYETFGDGW